MMIGSSNPLKILSFIVKLIHSTWQHALSLYSNSTMRQKKILLVPKAQSGLIFVFDLTSAFYFVKCELNNFVVKVNEKKTNEEKRIGRERVRFSFETKFETKIKAKKKKKTYKANK
ncbi:unnamed protein product [Rhizopus stolonifer]